MNVQYEQQGNYLIPCIRTKEQEEIHLGVLANRHRQYLKQNHKVRYYNLLTRERLYDYLDGVECQAEDLFEQTVKSLAEKEQVTEKLKAMNMMLWVQKMNNIRNRAKLLCNQPYSNHIDELIPCYHQYFHQKEWECFLYTKKSNFPLH